MECLFYAYGQNPQEDLPPIAASFDQPPLLELPTRMVLQNLPQDSYVFVDCVGTFRVDFLHAIVTLEAFGGIQREPLMGSQR